MFFTQIINFFIPPQHLDPGDDDYYKSKAVVVICMATACLIFLFLANRIRLNGLLSIPSITLASAAFAILVIPFVLKTTQSIKICTITLILVLAALIMELTFTTGGPLSPSLVFIPLFPLGGILFVSYRFGLFLSVLFAVHLGMLFWANQSGNLTTVSIDQSTMSVLHIATTIAATLIFVILAVLHVKWQNNMRAKLRYASEAKSTFLSGISHDLRTPLNAIMGFSEMLHRGMAGELNDKQTDFSKNIFSSSTHMLTLVNNLLDIAMFESGDVDFKPESVVLEDSISASLQMVKEAASEKHLRIESELDDSITGKTANLDRMKFKQIILNLLSNAIKYSPQRSTVWLKAGIIDDNIVITIADEGDGVSPEYAEQIFKNFFQVTNEINIKMSGSGLGLSMSRNFAELHEGTLELAANGHNSGACFVLTIPFKNVENLSDVQMLET